MASIKLVPACGAEFRARLNILPSNGPSPVRQTKYKTHTSRREAHLPATDRR